MISAVLDNATMAAELSPRCEQVQAILMGLLISGGMLIGNIPNIITAGKLKINSKEWAKLRCVGAVGDGNYFAILIIL